jgi:hypothetical protein
MCKVLSSAAEAELAAFFHNGKEACPCAIFLKSSVIQNLPRKSKLTTALSLVSPTTVSNNSFQQSY